MEKCRNCGSENVKSGVHGSQYGPDGQIIDLEPFWECNDCGAGEP